jgi:hypothetical protein
MKIPALAAGTHGEHLPLHGIFKIRHDQESIGGEFRIGFAQTIDDRPARRRAR